MDYSRLKKDELKNLAWTKYQLKMPMSWTKAKMIEQLELKDNANMDTATSATNNTSNNFPMITKIRESVANISEINANATFQRQIPEDNLVSSSLGSQCVNIGGKIYPTGCKLNYTVIPSLPIVPLAEHASSAPFPSQDLSTTRRVAYSKPGGLRITKDPIPIQTSTPISTLIPIPKSSVRSPIRFPSSVNSPLIQPQLTQPPMQPPMQQWIPTQFSQSKQLVSPKTSSIRSPILFPPKPQPVFVQPQPIQPQPVFVQPQPIQPQSIQPQSIQPQSIQPQRLQLVSPSISSVKSPIIFPPRPQSITTQLQSVPIQSPVFQPQPSLSISPLISPTKSPIKFPSKPQSVLVQSQSLQPQPPLLISPAKPPIRFPSKPQTVFSQPQPIQPQPIQPQPMQPQPIQPVLSLPAQYQQAVKPPITFPLRFQPIQPQQIQPQQIQPQPIQPQPIQPQPIQPQPIQPQPMQPKPALKLVISPQKITPISQQLQPSVVKQPQPPISQPQLQPPISQPQQPLISQPQPPKSTSFILPFKPVEAIFKPPIPTPTPIPEVAPAKIEPKELAKEILSRKIEANRQRSTLVQNIQSQKEVQTQQGIYSLPRDETLMYPIKLVLGAVSSSKQSRAITYTSDQQYMEELRKIDPKRLVEERWSNKSTAYKTDELKEIMKNLNQKRSFSKPVLIQKIRDALQNAGLPYE